MKPLYTMRDACGGGAAAWVGGWAPAATRCVLVNPILKFKGPIEIPIKI